MVARRLISVVCRDETGVVVVAVVVTVPVCKDKARKRAERETRSQNMWELCADVPIYKI